MRLVAASQAGPSITLGSHLQISLQGVLAVGCFPVGRELQAGSVAAKRWVWVELSPLPFTLRDLDPFLHSQIQGFFFWTSTKWGFWFFGTRAEELWTTPGTLDHSYDRQW